MRFRFLFRCVVAALLLSAPLHAQQIVGTGDHVMTFNAGMQNGVQIHAGSSFDAFDATALEHGKPVKDAPFTAEAVTEFTQVLGDGNRIERSFRASIARDGRGRVRRDEQIAMLGPLAVNGEPPRLVTIVDPNTGTSITLDEIGKRAHRNGMAATRIFALANGPDDVVVTRAAGQLDIVKPLGNQAIGGAFFEAAVAAPDAITERLGTRLIEGIEAEGTRNTMTIPAGAIGNVLPINVVTERWFSKALGMPLLIIRRDPRSGDTEYRLTNIVRAEPPADLFTVPKDYEVQEPRGSVGVRELIIERTRKVPPK